MQLSDLLRGLRSGGVDLAAEHMLDCFWLAHHVSGKLFDDVEDVQQRTPAVQTQPALGGAAVIERTSEAAAGPRSAAPAQVWADAPSGVGTRRASLGSVPSARALPNRLDFSRALRPFTLRRKSAERSEMDEEQTVDASATIGFPFPILKPSEQRWFTVDLVLEDDPAIPIWRQTLREFFKILHEALRSVFVATQGKPRVEVLPPDAGLPIVDHDLRERSDAEAALLDLCHQEGRTPFDLARGPLIRGHLVRMSDEEHVFLLTQHHIVSDGWSMGVLLRELSQLYRAFEAGQDDPLPPLAIQYPDYAAWQRQWLSGERLQKQAQYWRSALAGTTRLVLPTDRARPGQQSFAAATVPVTVDADLTRELKRLSLQHVAGLCEKPRR